MFRRFSVNTAVICIFIDGLLIALGFYASLMIRPLLNRFVWINNVNISLTPPGYLYPLFALTWLGTFLLFSVYDEKFNLKVTDELASLFLGSIVAAMAMAGELFFVFYYCKRYSIYENHNIRTNAFFAYRFKFNRHGKIIIFRIIKINKAEVF